MAASKNLYRRDNGMWYWRKQVPVDLIDFYTKTDLRGSLGTKDKKVAEARFHTRMAELNAEFDSHRAARDEANKQLQAVQQEAAANRTYEASPAFQRARGEAGQTVRYMEFRYDDQAFHDLETLDRASAIQMIDEALSAISYERQHQSSLVAFYDDQGEPRFVIPERHVDAVYRYLQSLYDAEEKSLRAKRAEIEARGEDASTDAQAGRLTALLPAWQAERDVSESALSDANTAIRLFEQVNGPLPYTDITSEHGRKFKNLLLSHDRKANTKKKLWGMLRAVLSSAKNNGLIKNHPLDDIAFNPKDDSVAREDFTPADLKNIFDQLGRGSLDWWLLRICLFAGARLGEVHQLTRKDIQQEEGVWFFSFTNEGEGQSLKNQNSRRKVPVHKQLIKDGIIEMLPEDGAVFSGTSAAASKRLNRAIRTAGVTSAGKVVHSTRHTFKSACREYGIGEDVHDRLTGHADAHVGRMYGQHSMSSLKREIDKVDFGLV